MRENIANMSPYRFEHLVLDLLEAMGYGGIDGGSRVTQKSNDGGIDGVINQDKLGSTSYIFKLSVGKIMSAA